MNPNPNKESYPFTFGRIVVDLRHQFFGHLNPSAFVIADMWADEEGGDEDVWCDHYRQHRKVPFTDLHNPEYYKVMGMADNTKNVHDQCKETEKAFQESEEGKRLKYEYDKKYHPERLKDASQ